MFGDGESHKQAYEYLEELQRSVFATMQLPTPPALRDEDELTARFRASWKRPELDEAEAKFRELIRPGFRPPTPFEIPQNYILLCGLANAVCESVADEAKTKLESIALGSLPTGCANALAMLVPDSTDYLIVFEWGLMDFAASMMSVLARAVQVSPQPGGGFSFSWKTEQVREQLRSDPEVAARFRHVLGTYLTKGYVLPNPDVRSLGEIRHGFFEQMWCGMLLFVLGHEFSHVIDGHLEHAAQRSATVGDHEATVLHNSWSDEFIADSMGVAMMAQTAHKKRANPVMAFLGAYAFFLLSDIIDRGLALLIEGEDLRLKHASHPPPEHRRRLLEGILEEFYKQQGMPDWGEKTVLMARHLKETTDVLFDDARPHLEQMHREGQRPARLWREVYDQALEKWSVT